MGEYYRMSGLKWHSNKTLLSNKSVLEISTDFKTLALSWFLMCSVKLNTGSISDTAHVKTIFSITLGIGNVSLVTYSILSRNSHFALFSLYIVSFTNPQRKCQRSQIWRTRGPGNGSLFSCPSIRKLRVQKGTDTAGEVGWCTI